jgi:hypothetical protein
MFEWLANSLEGSSPVATTSPAYRLDGTLMQACSCDSPCPCLVGLDPDRGHCDAVTAYHIDRGQAGRVDVSGLTVVQVVQVPGNIQAGHWREVLYVDDRASADQYSALIAAFSGKLGGPLADLASLVSDHLAAYAVPMTYTLQGTSATLRVGAQAVASAAGAPRLRGRAVVAVDAFRDSAGRPYRLENPGCTIVGSPAVYLGEAIENHADVPEYLISWTYSNHDGIQGPFHVEA